MSMSLSPSRFMADDQSGRLGVQPLLELMITYLCSFEDIVWGALSD
jgi:hypothetical protein